MQNSDHLFQLLRCSTSHVLERLAVNEQHIYDADQHRHYKLFDPTSIFLHRLKGEILINSSTKFIALALDRRAEHSGT